MEDLTWGGKHATQYTDDVLQDCAPETGIILFTSFTQINSIKKLKNKKQISIEGHSIKFLTSSTPQNCHSHQNQEKYEKLEF